MFLPLNRVVLNCLAEVDLFAVLALADTSSALRDFIHDQVLAVSLLLRFLRENQYLLHHDADYFRLLSGQQIVYLVRALESLRQRESENGQCIYDEILHCFSPLLALVPFSLFKKSPSLPDDVSVPDLDWNGNPARPKYTIEMAYWNYTDRLVQSWIHAPRKLFDNYLGFYDFHEKYAHSYLREEFLFCKRYIDDFNKSYLLLNPKGIGHTRKQLPPLLEFVAKINNSTASSFLLRKRCIQAVANYWYLSPYNLEKRTTTGAEFKTLMKSKGFLAMWDKWELGWWYSIGVWQYGPACVDSVIRQSFQSTRSCLLWLFLGAHHWFREKKRRRPELYHLRQGACCPSGKYDGCEQEYLIDLVASLTKDDRIWTMRQIIRGAPEYGVCRDLGANVFNYFVLHDLEVNAMMCILLEEIIVSPLQYLFEYAISIAIAEYQNTEGNSPLVLNEARKYQSKLLQKELDLYALLGNVENESLKEGISKCSLHDEM